MAINLSEEILTLSLEIAVSYSEPCTCDTEDPLRSNND